MSAEFVGGEFIGLVPHIKPGDWKAVQDAISKLATIRLGPDSTPTFGEVTVSVLGVTNGVISTLSFNTASGIAATLSSLAFNTISGVGATVSTLQTTSAIVASLGAVSAIISSLAVTSLSGVTYNIPVVTILVPSDEGTTVYLNDSHNTLFVYREK